MAATFSSGHRSETKGRNQVDKCLDKLLLTVVCVQQWISILPVISPKWHSGGKNKALFPQKNHVRLEVKVTVNWKSQQEQDSFSSAGRPAQRLKEGENGEVGGLHYVCETVELCNK